jgi:hypothetical protein
MNLENYVIENGATPAQPADDNTLNNRLGKNVNGIEHGISDTTSSFTSSIASTLFSTEALEIALAAGATYALARMGGGRLIASAFRSGAATVGTEAAGAKATEAAATKIAQAAEAKLATGTGAKLAAGAEAKIGTIPVANTKPAFTNIRGIPPATTQMEKRSALSRLDNAPPNTVREKVIMPDAPVPQFRRGRLVQPQTSDIPGDMMFGEHHYKPFGFKGLFQNDLPHKNPWRDSAGQAMVRAVKDGKL